MIKHIILLGSISSPPINSLAVLTHTLKAQDVKNVFDVFKDVFDLKWKSSPLHHLLDKRF